MNIGIMKKMLIGFVITIPIVSLLSISNPSYSAEIRNQKSTNINYTINGYTLNDREQAVFKTLLIDDFGMYVLKEGRKSLSMLVPAWESLMNNAIYVTAEQLQSDYEDNEVAGDKKYKNKTLFVSGIVSSINRSLGKNYYLSLVGGSNMFIQPQAHMANGFESYLANLKKGEKVFLVCQGHGMFMRFAAVNQCIPTNIWAEKQANNLIKAVDSCFVKANKEDDQIKVKVIVLSAIALASTLPEPNSCSGAGRYKYDECLTEIFKNPENQKAMKESSLKESRLKDAAIKLKIDFAEAQEFMSKIIRH